MLFPPLDKRNTRDKAKGLCVSSKRHIGELGTRYLSTLNRVQDPRQSIIRRDRWMKASRCMLHPLLGCGERVLGGRNILPLPGYPTYNVRARIGGESALSSYEFACLFGSLGDFSLPLHSQKKRVTNRRRSHNDNSDL